MGRQSMVFQEEDILLDTFKLGIVELSGSEEML